MRGAIPPHLKKAQGLYLCHRVQTSSEAHSASSPWILRVKHPGRKADHSPQSSAEVKNARGYVSTPQYVFIKGYSVKHRDSFILPPHDFATNTRSLNAHNSGPVCSVRSLQFMFFAKEQLTDQIKEDKMDRTFRAHSGGDEKYKF
jgi:hypothetical protein